MNIISLINFASSFGGLSKIPSCQQKRSIIKHVPSLVLMREAELNQQTVEHLAMAVEPRDFETCVHSQLESLLRQSVYVNLVLAVQVYATPPEMFPDHRSPRSQQIAEVSGYNGPFKTMSQSPSDGEMPRQPFFKLYLWRSSDPLNLCTLAMWERFRHCSKTNQFPSLGMVSHGNQCSIIRIVAHLVFSSHN